MKLKKVQLRDGVVAAGTTRKKTEHVLIAGSNADALTFQEGFVVWEHRGRRQLVPVHNVKGMEPDDSAQGAVDNDGVRPAARSARARR